MRPAGHQCPMSSLSCGQQSTGALLALPVQKPPGQGHKDLLSQPEPRGDSIDVRSNTLLTPASPELRQVGLTPHLLGREGSGDSGQRDHTPARPLAHPPGLVRGLVP